MMKAICRFFDNAKRVINESLKSERKITWYMIFEAMSPQYFALTKLKFEDPLQPAEKLQDKINTLCEEIDTEFRKLVLG